VILEIDVRGAAAVRERLPQSILFFLRPPSEEELARRLRQRRTETPEDLENRLVEARREIAEAESFDYKVVNDDVDRAAAEVAAIIEQRSVS
jgi:guanylate kinase